MKRMQSGYGAVGKAQSLQYRTQGFGYASHFVVVNKSCPSLGKMSHEYMRINNYWP